MKGGEEGGEEGGGGRGQREEGIWHMVEGMGQMHTDGRRRGGGMEGEGQDPYLTITTKFVCHNRN